MHENSIKKRIIISVTNDLVADQRAHKVASSLIKFGYDVLLVGRKLKGSFDSDRIYRTKRFRLLFRKSAFFYAEYNIRLFIFLLFRKADIFLSNDLDTLAANYSVSKIRNKKLVYDSHEYFTEVPELVNRKKIKFFWEKLERFILPKVKYSYTVCQSIADIYNKKYGIDMKLVRNIPECIEEKDISNSEIIPEAYNKKIILYQGSVNIGRGIEFVIDAMKYIDDAVFLILGDGDLKNKFQKQVKDSGLSEKVIFKGKIPFKQLISYTRKADVGITIEENIGLNYYYALPNKLFDYIRANVPVLASHLPEIEKVVNTYDIGCFIENHNPEHIAQKIKYMLQSPEKISFWKENLKKASIELCWENEEKILKLIFDTVI